MIARFNITKIDIKSYEYGRANNIEIKHELRMDKPPLVVVHPTPTDDQNTLRIEYQFSISYSPNMGYMIFAGFVDYFSVKNEEIKQNWDNPNSDVVNKTRTECSNAVFHNIIPIALLLSNRIGLPPVVQIPMIVFGQKKEKEEQQNYIG